MISAITSRFTRSSLVSRLSATVTAVSSLLTALRICGARKEKTAMTKSSHSIFAIKPVLRTAFGLALLAAIMLIFSSIEFLKSPFLARGMSEARSKKVAQADGSSSHTLVAAYYSVKGGLNATLMLSNQGPNEMPLHVQLYNRNGIPLDIAEITLSGQEVRALDLRPHIPEGSEFEDGSVQVEFQGRTLELGGLVILADPARSLIFEQELAEPTKDFASARLEGVWWRPTGNSEVKLALTNTSNSQLSVTVSTRGRGRRNSDSQTITLNSRETHILSMENHKNTDELDLRGRIGGISISHTGTSGALLSCGFIQEPSNGFSNVIVFSDPQKAKTTRLDGAGLRYGMVSGRQLSQIAIVRNVGSLPSVVSGHIPYTLADGTQSAISLPSIHLAPGEVEKINLPDIPGEVKIAGLEFSYSTSPGSVIATALSVSQDRNHVFRLPVRDASDQRSSTGHYPWSIDDDSATVVYIKNATDSPKRHTIFVSYEGGYWAAGEKDIPGGQTVVYDLRDLRDNQVTNSEGHTIPLTATGGQVHWSVRGQETRALVGRAEQANTSSGTSTTSACGVCCPDSFGYAWLTPGSVTGSIGGVTNFIAYRRDGTCYGGIHDYQWSYPGTGYPWGWSCDNTSVATVNGSGQATAVGVGFSYIRNTYYADVYIPNVEDCLVESVLANAAASCDVQCAYPVNFRQTIGRAAGGNLEFEYEFDSSTGPGKLSDLAGCVVGEIVTYPGGDPYSFPSPPYANNSIMNPYTPPDVAAEFGFISDVHSPPAGPTGFMKPYSESHINATQYYRYKCPCKEGGNYVNLSGPITIGRNVQLTPFIDWTYYITKSGVQALIQPLPQ